MVPIFGAIIPEPFAKPKIRIFLPPIEISSKEVFEKVSVVIIALDADKISFSTFLEMFAIVLILPIFDIVFSGNIEKYITLANSFFYFPKFSNDNNSTTFILLVVLAIFLIKNLLIIIINYYTTKFFFSVNLRIANDLFKYYLNSHYSFFLKNKSEDFLRKVYHDVDGIKTYLISYQTYDFHDLWPNKKR